LGYRHLNDQIGEVERAEDIVIGNLKNDCDKDQSQDTRQFSAS
jgi:hypothetical protein